MGLKEQKERDLSMTLPLGGAYQRRHIQARQVTPNDGSRR